MYPVLAMGVPFLSISVPLIFFSEEARVNSEVRQLFRSHSGSHHRFPQTLIPLLLVRACSQGQSLCWKLRLGKGFNRRKGYYKPTGKELQKRLVPIDFQGEEASEVTRLREYKKLYDGYMRCKSDMKELEIIG